MVLDISSLILREQIIDNAGVELSLYKNEFGAVILSAALINPGIKVFFETDTICLQMFYADKISLQELFEATTHNLVTVLEDEECKLYMLKDADIVLSGGDKLCSQF